jgi:hypothetical protein
VDRLEDDSAVGIGGNPLTVRTWRTQAILKPAAAMMHEILYLFIPSEN